MSVNIPIHEIYGMSETTGPTTVTTVEDIRFRSSGRPFNGAELKIHKPDEAGNGEVSLSIITVELLFLIVLIEGKSSFDSEVASF